MTRRPAGAGLPGPQGGRGPGSGDGCGPGSFSGSGPAQGLTRRRLLIGGAAATGAASLAACSSISVPPQRVAVQTGADAKGTGHFAALEVLAVSTYERALGPGAVKLPPAMTAFATAALSHHQRALGQWNSALALTAAPAVTQPPAGLQATVDQAFAKVTDAKTFAKAALLVEQTVSDSYLATMPTLEAKSAVTLAGAFQVMGAEHIAVLHFLLGEYPVPDVFQKPDHAVPA